MRPLSCRRHHLEDVLGKGLVCGGDECLSLVHGLCYVGQRVEFVVEWESVALEVEDGATGGVEDVVAWGEVPDRESFRELDHCVGEACGDMAQADGAEVD